MQPCDPLPNSTYGFIGLGVMGYGMAKNLRRKIPETSKLVICELVKQRCDQWVAEVEGKVEVAHSPREDIIITMLPRGSHVLDAFTNAQTGLLSVAGSAATEMVFIECSTIEVAISLEVRRAVAASGLGIFVDSPVSGGRGGADNGTLTFMIGGEDAAFKRIRPIVATMANPESIFHCGRAGAGLATKQINNYLSAVSMLGVCEAMDLGSRYGLDPKTLAGVINVSTGMCYNSREQNPVKGVSDVSSAAKDFEDGFSTELCQGVLNMSIDLRREVGGRSVLAGAVARTYQKAVETDCCKGKDFRSVYKLFADDEHALDELSDIPGASV
ncbi:hypothetical protein EKO04_003942 [Ascochyta lentis]|uniref:3-hydroxyisobutyrate dehydrogenase n=1 Tax=Ascochyta lentis TaxID=205686 RepID=A0A8H7J8V2_9PLEO|nr:hypothetical protein EKO04_003942 [Ascochyta lentis]